jgi:valyl-tRNA synthetase
MPFVTEELWRETAAGGPARESLLILSPWPELDGLGDPGAEADLDWLIAVISGIRSVRTEMNVPGGAQVPLVVVGGSAETRGRIERHAAALTRLARLGTVSHADDVPADSAQIVVGEATFALPLAGIIDLSAERARLEKEIAREDAETEKIDRKLGNAQFIATAPEEVVEEQRARRAEAVERRARLLEALSRLR